MEKFIGIVKQETRSMIGVQVKLLTRFNDSQKKLEEWIKKYPETENIIMENTTELDSFFRDFEDFTPITEEEKERAKKALDNLMKTE